MTASGVGWADATGKAEAAMQGRPVRICVNALLLPPTFGGIGNVTYHLLKNLIPARPEWEFTLLVGADTAKFFRGIAGLRIEAVPLRSRTARLAYLHLLFPFRARRFSLLHSTGNMGLVFCPVPQVITIHDTYEKVSPERFGVVKRALMSLLISLSGRRARRIIAVSHSTRKDVERHYPGLRGKISVIHSGNKFPVREDAAPGDRSAFLFVGTLEPGKNMALVLRAFAELRKTRSARLRIIGPKGWSQGRIPELIASLGIGADLEFLGFISDDRLREEYSRAFALIQASTYEGFGLPVIEAMACGCPVIAARNSGLIEAGGDAALFFRTNDLGDLVEKMALVLDRPEVRADSIRSGWEHAKRFTWEKAAAETGLVYRESLGA